MRWARTEKTEPLATFNNNFLLEMLLWKISIKNEKENGSLLQPFSESPANVPHDIVQPVLLRIS